MILPSTAEETGGKCMACKQGIRADIEASRAYYQQQKKYDPLRELWVSLVKRSASAPSLEGWSQAEKRYFSVSLLEREVHNGGFDQYFSNSAADFHSHAVQGLNDFGALTALRVVNDAAATLFGNYAPPSDRSRRWKIMHSRMRRVSDFISGRRREIELDRLDKEFYSVSDDLNDRLVAYAKHHKLDEPFQVR